MGRQKLLIRHLRWLSDKTLDDVGSATGIDITTLSRIERGLVPGTEAQRNAIAGYFGRPIDELLGPISEQVVA